MKKRLLCLLLVLTMLLTMLPVAVLAENVEEGTTANPFRDVSRWDWYYEDVQYVRVNQIFNGVSETLFDPNGTMTRGMFVTVLGRMAGVDPVDYMGKNVFSDVADDAYYAPYVAWASIYGITEGTGDGMFSPDMLINRQQLATFLVRYFEAFDVIVNSEEKVETKPKDLVQVAEWAEDAVVTLWQLGLVNGDGTYFNPADNATRAQTAAICTRMDEVVECWYKEPGVVSERVRLDPETGLPYEEEEKKTNMYAVSFYDGTRHIDTLYAYEGNGPHTVPRVEKSSKAGHILLGYYLDPEFTMPFYAETPIFMNTKVYAKYQAMESQEELTPRTFTQMDADPGLEFTIEPVSAAGEMNQNDALLAATVLSKDGSDPVSLDVRDNGNGTYTIYAPDGFNEGCAYELTLSTGWVFTGKEDSIRTASFTIAMEEVENLRMGDDIVYIADTADMDYRVAGGNYEELTSAVLELLGENDTGSFSYSGDVETGDVLCIYVGTRPDQREGGEVLDPAVYVKAASVSGSTVTFEPLDDADQQELYEVPDNFPIQVTVLPDAAIGAEGNTASMEDLDIQMYQSMVGLDEATMEKAMDRLSVGDFVTLYVSDTETELTSDESDYCFGLITAIDGAAVTYTRVTRQDIIDSMNLHVNVDLTADDLLDEQTMMRMEADILSQVEASGFAEEAAYMLVDMATMTREFREDAGVQDLLLTDGDGNPLSDDQIELLGSGAFTLDDVDLDVRLGTGSRFNGVEIVIGVRAAFSVEAEDGTIAIKLSASFTEEAMIDPGVDGDLVYKEILGVIPIPIGVRVSAHVDIKNFTAFSFDAEVTTKDSDNNILGTTSIASDLEDLMHTAKYDGLDDEYFQSMDQLMERYSQLLQEETDWIKLVEQEIFAVEMCYYGLALGVEVDFVVRTDMSIAIGSSLSYEVGKRYSFWFKIGLFEPTAGSDTMDLLDEQFKFQFYVMGKLGVKAGIKAKVYAGLGSGKIASVGIAAELGPYLKLWGFFIYNYERTRPMGSSQWQTSSYMQGGLNLEFGLYFILSFEAEALGLFEYSHDFLNEEYPLLETGEPRYYYGMFYHAKDPLERVFVWDDDRDSTTGISMVLPERLWALSYVDLKTGVTGAEVLSPTKYHITLSNSNFAVDDSGIITVTVPEGIHYMECDLTITYLHGKAAFSDYDMSTTVPLVWTDLGRSELKEYYTVSVMVGSDVIWSTRVLRGQSFDLPTDEAIRKMAGWSELKYSAASGYAADQQLKGLTVSKDTTYFYAVEPRTYSITVNGIQNADGGTYSETFTAKYGETFDFSVLENTGTDLTTGDNPAFTKFTGVTTDATIETDVCYDASGSYIGMAAAPIDLTQPITGAMARYLMENDVTATANYVDDSVTAVFTFNGLTHGDVEDVVVTMRKGTIPSMTKVTQILDDEVRKNNGTPLGIAEVYPALDEIYTCTNYVVTCVGLSGERALVTFDCNPDFNPYHFYYEPAPVDKLVGSLIIDIPDPVRRGYSFLGWYTEDGQNGSSIGQSALTQTVPAEGITLYAQWKANTYLVTYDTNVEDTSAPATPDPMVITYDETYNQGNVYIESLNKPAVGIMAKEYGQGDAYGNVPVLNYTTNYGFLGWSTYEYRHAPGGSDNIDDPRSHKVTNETLANIYADTPNGHSPELLGNHTLYAQWKDRIDIQVDYHEKIAGGLFQAARVETTYDGTDQSDLVNVIVKSGVEYPFVTYEGTETRTFKMEDIKGLTIKFKSEAPYADWKTTAVNAGLYDILIEWPGDNDFKPGKVQLDNVLRIKKASSSMSGTLTGSNATIYKATVLGNDSGLSYTSGYGVGAVEFGTTTGSGTPTNWTTGPIYNVCQGAENGDFKLYARLGEGLNYKASDPIGPVSLSLGDDRPGNINYRVVVKTGSAGNSGTDSSVAIQVGSLGQWDLPDRNGDHDNHETSQTDTHTIYSFGSGFNDGLGAKDVTIKITHRGGNNPGWNLYSVRIDTYSGSSKVAEGQEIVYDQWLAATDHGDVRSTTKNNIPIYGRSLSYTMSGPADQAKVNVSSGSSTTVSLNQTVTDNHPHATIKTYNAYERYDAPEFVATFSEDGFDQFITWSFSDGEWVASFNHKKVLAEMNKLDVYSMTFTYGVKGDVANTRIITINK